MWAYAEGIDGTIGGGTLELEAIGVARKMLVDDLPEWHRELRAIRSGQRWANAAAAWCGCSSNSHRHPGIRAPLPLWGGAGGGCCGGRAVARLAGPPPRGEGVDLRSW